MVIPKIINPINFKKLRYEIESKLKENYNFEKDAIFYNHQCSICNARPIIGIDYMWVNWKKLDLWQKWMN